MQGYWVDIEGIERIFGASWGYWGVLGGGGILGGFGGGVGGVGGRCEGKGEGEGCTERKRRKFFKVTELFEISR